MTVFAVAPALDTVTQLTTAPVPVVRSGVAMTCCRSIRTAASTVSDTDLLIPPHGHQAPMLYVLLAATTTVLVAASRLVTSNSNGV
ncbi:hypothetical protein ACQEVZ_24250 [Dactylosporangium sp. CA-152071]|uniref:hypothetical protein n=1 Tax=Dactylosporangium sp. CA-152071 TaxID=3239933 RepID=UPI003D9098BD